MALFWPEHKSMFPTSKSCRGEGKPELVDDCWICALSKAAFLPQTGIIRKVQLLSNSCLPHGLTPPGDILGINGIPSQSSLPRLTRTSSWSLSSLEIFLPWVLPKTNSPFCLFFLPFPPLFCKFFSFPIHLHFCNPHQIQHLF